MIRKLYGIILVAIALLGCNSSGQKTIDSITVKGLSSQTTTINTAFAAPLAATVTASGVPVSGVLVNFAAPATGASGTFAGGVNSSTSDANGVATSAIFTANTTVGGPYTVTASVSGLANTAVFSLTNASATAASITATDGAAQSTRFGANFATPLVVTVLDAGGNPVTGATVTFTPPATGASGTFLGGTNTSTTNASGIATSADFTANSIVGGPYLVTATVPGVGSSASFSLTNTPAQFSFYLSGLEQSNDVDGRNFYALAGSINLDGTGRVLGGVQDYNDGYGYTSPEPSGDSITGGNLIVDSVTGQGTLTLITNNALLGVNGTETLGVQFVNPKHAMIIQFDGTGTSTGGMDLQTLPASLNGAFSFTISGINANYEASVSGGVFTVNGNAVQNGVLDTAIAGTVTRGSSFTASISAPDSFGRGTVTGSGLATTLNYYIVGSEVVRIIAVDAEVSGLGSAYGQGASAGMFNQASLGSSVFGVMSNSWGRLYASAGMFTTTPSDGTFLGIADNDEEGTVESGAAIRGTYSIASTGYGSLTIAADVLGDVSELGIYLTDPHLNLNDPNNTISGLGGGLITDLDTNVIGSGLFVPRTDTATTSLAGNYAFGAQAFFGSSSTGWEYDFVGQGSFANGVLTGTGLASDPASFFGGDPAIPEVNFSGTVVPDTTNAGRYTIMAPNPFVTSVAGLAPVNNQVVLYQANGGQLFWLDADADSLFLGTLQKQALPVAPVTANASIAKAKRLAKP